MINDKRNRRMNQINFGIYDTEILIRARRSLENVFCANYTPSSRQSALLQTIISKLDRLLIEYGSKDEIEAYFGKIAGRTKNENQ